jgi:hypothetical protein
MSEDARPASLPIRKTEDVVCVMKYIEERDGVGEKSVCCVIKVGAEVYP